jgi:hypothetical protein
MANVTAKSAEDIGRFETCPGNTDQPNVTPHRVIWIEGAAFWHSDKALFAASVLAQVH